MYRPGRKRSRSVHSAAVVVRRHRAWLVRLGRCFVCGAQPWPLPSGTVKVRRDRAHLTCLDAEQTADVIGVDSDEHSSVVAHALHVDLITQYPVTAHIAAALAHLRYGKCRSPSLKKTVAPYSVSLCRRDRTETTWRDRSGGEGSGCRGECVGNWGRRCSWWALYLPE